MSASTKISNQNSKRINERIFLLALVFSLVLIAGCAQAPEPPQLAAENITKSWLDLSTEQCSARLFKISGEMPRHMAIEDGQLQFLELGSTQNNNQENSQAVEDTERDKTPWLLVHGLGGSMGDWAPLFVEAATRHRVFAIDLPGFGGSTSSTNEYSIIAFVRALRQFAAGIEEEEFHLVCHSLGGQVCLALSLDHPKLVKSLTLIDAAGTYNQEEFIQRMTRTRAGISLGDIRIARNAGFEMLLGGNLAILKRILGHDPFILSALASFKSSYRSRVRDLQVPTLIIWGIDDPLFPADYGFYLKENIEGSFLRLIPNAGHTPQLSDPDLIEELVSDFHNNIPVRKE